MRVFVTVQHPAHVHFFRNAVTELRDGGHDVRVYAREKEMTTRLLDQYGIDYHVLAGAADSLASLAKVQATYELQLWREALRHDPDVLTAISGLAASHVATVIGATSVIFTDNMTPTNKLFAPFANVVCTPRNHYGDFGIKHVRYDGYHELAYLHPNRFQPDPDVLRAHGVDPEERFFVLRFSDMGAHHDVGQEGLSPSAKREVVDYLSNHGTVYASIEGEDELSAREIPVPPHRIHHLLAMADIFVTDSSTMPTEAGLLGTPTVRSNSFAGEDDVMCNFVELQEYGLVYSTPDESDALETVRDLTTDPTARDRWADRRDRVLAEKIDVTSFITDILTAPGARGTVDRSVESPV
jgi:predicted glycosyltransferase